MAIMIDVQVQNVIIRFQLMSWPDSLHLSKVDECVGVNVNKYAPRSNEIFKINEGKFNGTYIMKRVLLNPEKNYYYYFAYSRLGKSEM